mmetsp:Transcript_45351/g.120270  ORF Transcript_45351/g.120270 Transcript_45351/m.120270 type:complete len:135 (-) Transcript_45351:132-536(-)
MRGTKRHFSAMKASITVLMRPCCGYLLRRTAHTQRCLQSVFLDDCLKLPSREIGKKCRECVFQEMVRDRVGTEQTLPVTRRVDHSGPSALQGNFEHCWRSDLMRVVFVCFTLCETHFSPNALGQEHVSTVLETK